MAAVTKQSVPEGNYHFVDPHHSNDDIHHSPICHRFISDLTNFPLTFSDVIEEDVSSKDHSGEEESKCVGMSSAETSTIDAVRHSNEEGSCTGSDCSHEKPSIASPCADLRGSLVSLMGQKIPENEEVVPHMVKSVSFSAINVYQKRAKKLGRDAAFRLSLEEIFTAVAPRTRTVSLSCIKDDGSENGQCEEDQNKQSLKIDEIRAST